MKKYILLVALASFCSMAQNTTIVKGSNGVKSTPATGAGNVSVSLDGNYAMTWNALQTFSNIVANGSFTMSGNAGTITSGSITANCTNGNFILTSAIQFPDGSTISKRPTGQINAGTVWPALATIGLESTNVCTVTGVIPNSGWIPKLGLPTDRPTGRMWVGVVTGTNQVSVICTALLNVGAYTNSNPIAVGVIK